MNTAGELLLLVGALLTLASAIGMFRFRDVFTRMHALAKASTLAVVLMLLGGAVSMSHPNDVTSLLLAAALQVLTSPLASNMISFTTYREDGTDVLVTVMDDDVVAPAERAEMVDEVDEDVDGSDVTSGGG